MIQTLELISEGILIILGFYLACSKSYFQEKGKNLATSEDIEEITSKVEGIKTEFLQETESLKSELQYLNQVRFSLKSEEIKSLFDFYEKYSVWLNILLSTQLSDLKEEYETQIIETNKKINKAYLDFLHREAKFNLLIQDKKLIEQSYLLKIKTIELQGFVLIKLIEYKHFVLEYKEIESLDSSVQFTKLQAIFEKDKVLNQDFVNDRLKHYAPIAVINAEFQTKSYALLKNMSQR